MGLIRRVAGSVIRPRATLAELVRQPVWADTWLLVLAVFAAGAIWLLSTDVGRQALVDERVRVIETFGGTVDDTQYGALLAHPPWWTYFTSGGRLLLTPEVTLLVAVVCWAIARRDNAGVRFTQALSIVVHATVVLALGQLVAAPLHYRRETLTSPLNLAAVLPLMEEGTVPARFFGTIDLFAVWWIALLAIGLGAMTGRSIRRYATALSMVYIGFAAVMAGVIAAVGGS
jgi:Yip1-like protein